RRRRGVRGRRSCRGRGDRYRHAAQQRARRVARRVSATVLDPAQRLRVQRRTVLILAIGQVLGGIAFGSTVSLGALLAADISGSDALSGFATAATTRGAAIAAIPLARMASRLGRRRSLTLGNLFALVGVGVVIVAAAVRSFPLLIGGI